MYPVSPFDTDFDETH